MKLPKMNKVCGNDELRPILDNVFVTKKNVTATNQHVLVSHATKELFDKDFIANIPEEGIYIDAEDWKMLTTEFILLSMDKNLLITVGKNKKTKYRETFFKALKVKDIGLFPPFEFLFKGKKNAKYNCGEFGLDSKILLILSEAIGSSQVHLKCTDSQEPIFVCPRSTVDYPSVRAVIMPVIID